MSGYDDLTLKVRARRRELDALSGEARSVLSHGKTLMAEISELEHQIVTLDKTAILLTSLGEERQLQAQQVIEELVTRGLQTIFDDTLSFHIVQTVRAKASAVDFYVRTTFASGQMVDTPVLESRGGGVAATIGFLLRVVVMLLRNGTKQENILILDESFGMVSDDYLENVGTFLRELVDKTGIQIILVTHQKEFIEHADRVYRFAQSNGRTEVASV